MQLVRRTLNVLRYLASEPHPAGLVEVAGALEQPQPTVHRLLAVLMDEEFVVRSPDKKYSLGPAALSLSRGPRMIGDLARPYMQELTSRTGETSFLTEMVGSRAVCTALVDGTRALRLFVRIGQAMPVHAAASARAILAFLPEDERRTLLATGELIRYTDGTLVTMDAVLAELAEVHRRGYDVCDEELDRNVVAISAPVYGSDGEVRASITIAAPRDRVDASVEEQWIRDVLLATEGVSRECGYAGRPRLEGNQRLERRARI